MSIVQIGRSSAIVWSRNPIWAYLSYSGLTPGSSIQVQVMDSVAGAPLGSPLRFPIVTASGTLDVLDLEKIIDPYLEWKIPAVPLPASSEALLEDYSSKKYIHLRYREYSITNDQASWIGTSADGFLVIKGGIGDLTLSGEKDMQRTWYQHLFFPNTDGHAHPWLSYRPVFGNIIHNTEWGFLYYFHNEGLRPIFLYTVFYADGTSQTFTRNVTGVSPWQARLWRIPIGVSQAKLDPTNKKVVSYRIQINEQNVTGIPKVYAFMDFEVDHKPVFKTMNLFYRNSVGGIDNILLRGVMQRNGASFEKRSFQSGDRYTNFKGDIQNYHSQGTIKFVGNTGYLDEEELMRLYDLYNNTEFCALLYNDNWIPIRVPQQEMKPIASDGFLHSYEIEFETAGTFSTMPRQLNALLK